jgi:hypothetical protein
MNIPITIKIDIEEIALQTNHKTAKELILKIDEHIADYDFTVNIINKLVESLKKEHVVSDDFLDIYDMNKNEHYKALKIK